MDLIKTIIISLLIIIFILLVFVLLGWFGGKEAAKDDAKCLWGGGSFCWKWQKTFIDEIKEGFDGSKDALDGIVGFG